MSGVEVQSPALKSNSNAGRLQHRRIRMANNEEASTGGMLFAHLFFLCRLCVQPTDCCQALGPPASCTPCHTWGNCPPMGSPFTSSAAAATPCCRPRKCRAMHSVWVRHPHPHISQTLSAGCLQSVHSGGGAFFLRRPFPAAASGSCMCEHMSGWTSEAKGLEQLLYMATNVVGSGNCNYTPPAPPAPTAACSCAVLFHRSPASGPSCSTSDACSDRNLMFILVQPQAATWLVAEQHTPSDAPQLGGANRRAAAAAAASGPVSFIHVMRAMHDSAQLLRE